MFWATAGSIDVSMSTMQHDMTRIGVGAGRVDMREFPSVLCPLRLLVMEYQPLLFRCFHSTGNKTSHPLKSLSSRKIQATLCEIRRKESSLTIESRYDVLLVRLPQNIPTAILCATGTPILLGGKPVVVTEFFALLDISFGDNPDSAFGDQDFTVGITGMVNVAGFVLQGFAINIVAVVEFKDILIALL